MTVNELIIETLSGIAPTSPWVTDEDSDRDLRRILFNYTVMPESFFDDTPVYDRYLIQVHYFCPINDDSVAVRKSIRKALFAAGFTYPDETTVGTGLHQASKEQHYCFECEYLEAIWAEDE